MIIVDNFLKEDYALTALRSEELWENQINYQWNDKTQTNNPIEVFCKFVWETFFLNEYEKVDGFEYWTNILSSDGVPDLGWHFDKDEHLFEKSNELNCPNLGFVYYVHKDCPEGGYLEIKHEDDEVERIKPIPNRLVIFNPSYLHRVTDVTKNTRLTLACNLWLKKPSEENFGKRYN